MASAALICCMLALCLSGTILVASAQQSVSHYGGGGGGGSSYNPREPVISKYNPATKHYEPVTWDKQYTYYRLKVVLSETFSDVFTPDPSKPSVVTAVISGDVLDRTTGVKVGTFDSYSITTTISNAATKELQYLSTLAVELGPNGDDTIFVQAALDRANFTQEPTDFEMAISGGTGRYKGATGEVLHSGTSVTTPDGDTVYVAEVAVPKFKRF